MMRMLGVIGITALLAFGAGVWTESRMLAASVTVQPAATISPRAMHLQVRPNELPVLQVDNYN